MTAIWRAGPHDREILRLAIPALGSLVAEPLYLLVDAAVVGHLGTDALAGLAIASTALLLIYSIFIFLTYGTTASVARLLGAGAHGDAAHEGVQSMWLAVGLGVVLAIVGASFADPLLSALGATGEVAVQATIYFRVSLVGLPALLLVLAGTGYLRGLQDTRTPLVVAVVSVVANLVLELVFIYGLGYGIGASAAATVVAQWGAAAVYVVWVGRAVRHQSTGLRPDLRAIGSLGRVGGQLFVRTVALRAVLTVGTAVAARLGAVSVAAYAIAFGVWNLLALVLDAIAIAGQAMTGRFLGATDVRSARSAGRRMLEWGVGLGVVLGAVIALLHGVLPRIFTDDPAVIATASSLLVITAVMQPANGAVFVLDGLLIGAGDMAYLAVAMLIGLAVFAPLAWAVAATGSSVEWLFAALGVFMASRLVTLGWRWHTGAWAITGP